MALVNGTEYYFIDMQQASGGDTTRHLLKDTNGRAMIAPTEASSTAGAAHPKGSYFIYNGVLYQATADIAAGGTITPGTNCLEKPLGDAVFELQEDFDKVCETVASKNLLNPAEITEGYISPAGDASSNADYNHSGYIHVTPGQTLYFSYWENPIYSYIGRTMKARFLAAYDANKAVISAAGVEKQGSYTVPDGVAYIIISWSVATYEGRSLMVEVSETGITQYAPYGDTKTLDADIEIPNADQVASLLGNGGLSVTGAAMAQGDTITIDAAPRFVKKNVSLTFYGTLTGAFSSLTIGKGYTAYRGKWVVIDDTNITVYNDTTSTVIATEAHGLTISEYIAVNMRMGADGVCAISINTLSGTYTTTVNFGYEWNYAPFATVEQAMTGCKLSVMYEDLTCPLWIIGDSYCGVAENRVIGQLKALGYFGFCVDAIAGGEAYTGKSMIDDLLRMLALATPRVLIWAIGMNGSADSSMNVVNYLIPLCQQKGIVLILYKTPNVPGLLHNDLNAAIAATGLRYIDAYRAVGSDAEGNWYNGFLSQDEVHPTITGAKAIAMMYLSDAPEIMQYAGAGGVVSGEISGDQ